MKIHGFFYVIVGTTVAVISKIINSPKLMIFFYAGILFGFFGIAKMLLQSRKDKSPKPVHENHYVSRHHRVTREQSFSAHYCHRCGFEFGHYDNFCSRCGQRKQNL
ncbi:MAG: hypothetical protein V1837_06950 [Candidatus Woesearchaeota archaeon]